MASKTKILIMESFEKILRSKKLEQINIVDITDESGLNRKTFYYYFSDVEHLIYETFDYEVNYYYDNLPKNTSIGASIEGFFNMCYENKEIIYHIYNSTGSEHLVNFIQQKVYKIHEHDVLTMCNGKKITENQIDIIANALSFITAGFIIKWVDEGMKQDVSSLVDELIFVLKGLPAHMINNCLNA